MVTSSRDFLFVFFSCLFVASESTANFRLGRYNEGFVGHPKATGDEDLPKDQWFKQTLDHFNDADTRTWQQRYFVNDQYYDPSVPGPVFIMIGGEGTADPIWMVKGHWIELAQKYKAICFMLEHRYYGKSHPVPDMRTENMMYLSSEQALADLANYRQAMQQMYKLLPNKWVTFGGSYPGSLSAWFRLKYPHLVDVAVATSAPMYGIVDFAAYLGVVRDSLATTGSDSCNTNIKTAVTKIEGMVHTTEGRALLKTKFKLCTDLDKATSNDVSNLYSAMAGNFEGVVQYNKDNRAFEGAVGTNITIDTLCQIMRNPSIGDEVDRYAAVNTLLMKTYNQTCLDYSYNDMIKELQQTEWSSSAAVGGRQWTYQTCTEFGYYQSSDLSNQPFGQGFPIDFWVQQCADIYGPQFTKELLEKGINRTNQNYGGLGIKVTKVIFPNGSIDPWHALGITKSLSPEAVAVFIKGTAHCANMYPSSPDDSPALIQARIDIDKTLDMWLNSS